ncbi:TetR/AcrR family transcriptional regulator [Tropicimonas sp. TH_r6]|uniref:TetR/AcrR family transcriptional regulator n=1 Tax=Tropicimonas sp. TH_r6 TaxID=3082085 RepID=UPI00295322B5|nr:TetR/AcrR family transcriptional regulator [Tropicimonas sp. TH_r6]MDV7142664.1 TetR/AcrR family transcriptional regulator [Tropicimonas sp. TH_r6]
MSDKTDARREALRQNLTDIAERQIASAGLSSLKARALAGEAGCSVGAIYNVFEDLDGLIMDVNGRTFRRLGDEVRSALASAPDATPQERLVLMSCAYLHFAEKNEFLWRCLFDIRMSNDTAMPDWYRDALEALFALISEPLIRIFTSLGAEDVSLMTRALFSSVHGIVLLGLEDRISGVPRAQIERMIELLLLNLTAQHSVS